MDVLFYALFETTDSRHHRTDVMEVDKAATIPTAFADWLKEKKEEIEAEHGLPVVVTNCSAIR